MAKKKKGKKKGKKKEAAPPDPILLEIQTYPLDKVNAQREELRAKLKEIRRNRNYYMLERDAIQQYHYIVCQENEELKAEIRNLESEVERKTRAHRDAIKIYLQKVTHLEYEHSHNLAMVKEARNKELHEEAEFHNEKRQELYKMKAEIEQDFEKEKKDQEAQIKLKQEQNREELAAMRAAHEEKHLKLKKKYDRRLQQLIEDLELRRKIEIHEIEERKNGHINQLIENHEKSFNGMRAYYNSLTKDNLGLIKSLKDELTSLKTRQEQHEKTIADYNARNKQLQQPKSKAEAEVAELQEKLKNYQKDKLSLKHSRQRAITLEENLKQMRREQKKLEVKFNAVKEECKELYDTFDDVVVSVKKKGEAQNGRLEELVKKKSNEFAEKKAQFTSLIKTTQLDPVAIGAKLDSDLASKNTELKQLQYENAKIAKAHDDLVRVYEAKLRKMGIPEGELNTRPFVSKANTAPADVII
mmetsp:Transcript_19438/g.30849  ORF Transcript_19438/g.30849 Transcript_19438/m.30849 type:complete len:471 (+) Transcript_19438:55-1467(+)